MPDRLPRDVEFGFDEIESNPFVVDESDDYTMTELADLDGVGRKTVRKLERAGIREPSDLYGLSQQEIAAVNGIGPKKAAKLRRQVLQRGNRQNDMTWSDDDIEKATKQHAERSPRERRADESFNAKISLNYSQWEEDPAKYDMPGVDTIPRDRRLERTKRAAGQLAEDELVDSVEATPSGPGKRNVRGNATGGTVRVKTAQDDPESTLAHELGHQADKIGGGRASMTNELFGPNMGDAETEKQESLRAQGAKLASRRRKLSLKPEAIEDKAEKGQFGGGGFNEVFADAFAEAVEEPRRAKSEAPDLVREMKREFQDQKDGFNTPF